jgi:hypothetical protein
MQALIKQQLTKCGGYREEEIEKVEWLSGFRIHRRLIVVLTPVNGQLSDLLLIRPDAHLAWRGRPVSAQLSRWLADALERGIAS